MPPTPSSESAPMPAHVATEKGREVRDLLNHSTSLPVLFYFLIDHPASINR